MSFEFAVESIADDEDMETTLALPRWLHVDNHTPKGKIFAIIAVSVTVCFLGLRCYHLQLTIS
jgi:hypothetical protein